MFAMGGPLRRPRFLDPRLMDVETSISDRDVLPVPPFPFPALVATRQQDRFTLLVERKEHPDFRAPGGAWA